VDVPTFAKVCELGDPDAAATYLILAAGTGPDNKTSSWSREAINRRTALNWRRADACITKLEKAGFVRWLVKGTRKPRLSLPIVETRKALTPKSAQLVAELHIGCQPRTKAELNLAEQLEAQGWIEREGSGWREIAERPFIRAYMPNSLVGDETGRATGESTIVDRIRMARDAMAFHLLVHLYQAQDLAELGGVDRTLLRQVFERETHLATGQFQVWAFKQTIQEVHWVDATRPHWVKPEGEKNGAVDYFARVRILEDAGALEWAYMLAEDQETSSIPVYPVAVVRHGKVDWSEPESVAGAYASRAACALIDEPQMVDRCENAGPQQFLLPADRLARKATLVGIPRLRGRARTANARRWLRERTDTCREWIQAWRGVIAEHAPEMLAEADTRFADFNAASTVPQGGVQGGLQREVNGPRCSAMHDFPFPSETAHGDGSFSGGNVNSVLSSQAGGTR
jgi:hypothetical protein